MMYAGLVSSNDGAFIIPLEAKEFDDACDEIDAWLEARPSMDECLWILGRQDLHQLLAFFMENWQEFVRTPDEMTLYPKKVEYLKKEILTVEIEVCGGVASILSKPAGVGVVIHDYDAHEEEA